MTDPGGDSDGAARADWLIKALELAPHPEGGHYRETFRDARGRDGRALSTAILFLLRAGEISHWHRVDAVEIWHWHEGAPLELSTADADGEPMTSVLGAPSVGAEGSPLVLPQLVVPANHWQSARSLGSYTLVGCTVAPGFVFDGFELAPVGWSPNPTGEG